MRMTCCMPVTPTREMLRCERGRRACTSVAAGVAMELGSFIDASDDTHAKRGCDSSGSGVWWLGGWDSHRRWTRSAIRARHDRANPGALLDLGGDVDVKEDRVLLLDRPDASFADIEELRPLLAEARERGFVTFEELASCLEEVDVTKEQLRDLRSYLVDHGIDVLSED